MSFTLSCYTLFDITPTGVMHRNKPNPEEDHDMWLYKRNTQCNFDTVLQAISLRSQPDLTTSVKRTEIRLDEFTDFGFLFEQQDDETYPCWSFDFEIQHGSVFSDGITELGALYTDCEGVPMIKCDTEWDKLPPFLDTTSELRNIYFKVISND
jgi:hypothetical protein